MRMDYEGKRYRPLLDSAFSVENESKTISVLFFLWREIRRKYPFCISNCAGILMHGLNKLHLKCFELTELL